MEASFEYKALGIVRLEIIDKVRVGTIFKYTYEYLVDSLLQNI